MLASIRANKEHERRGKYQLMSREVPWLLFLPLCQRFATTVSSDLACLEWWTEDLLVKYHGNTTLVDGIIATKELLQ